MTSHLRWLALVVVSGLAAAGFVAACNETDGRCSTDADCPAARCDVDSGACVECTEITDCGDGEACCQGTCRAGPPEALCGCEAGPGGRAPTACGDQVCVSAAGARVALAEIATGACECPCDPAQGGTVCTINAASEVGFSCGCDRADPVGTCEAAALDASGIPHRPADTCSPQNSCVCFAAAAVCSGSSDCTSGGCLDLVTDAANCGVAARSCSDDATGVAGDARCVGGGCVCNDARDCQATGLNVDACAFIGDVSLCVCDAYTSGDVKAACPMGLACGDGGCLFEGTAYATRDALVEAVSGR